MAKSETGKILEETLDVVDETLDTLERIPEANLNGTTKKQAVLILGATALVSAGVGGFITYKFMDKKIRLKYEAIAEEEIEEARNFYRTMAKDGDFSTPESTVEALIPEEDRVVTGPDQLKMKVEELKYDILTAESEVETGEDDISVRNVFKEAQPEAFDYEAEVAKRTEEVPYIITIAEYMSGDKGYEQQTLTYFEGDDVLLDDRDSLVEEVEATVGHDNLEKFGYGSNDKMVVYVRNERHETDYEILLSKGDAAKEVFGFDESSLEHSDNRRPRRMRREDE